MPIQPFWDKSSPPQHKPGGVYVARRKNSRIDPKDMSDPRNDPFDGPSPGAQAAAGLALDLIDAGAAAHRARPGAQPGELIRDLRRGRNWTQESLAAAAGLPQARLCRIERGTSDPRWSQISRLLEALGCAPVLHARKDGDYRVRCIPDE
jgi:DNA-binding XRE family transcriptional regulator